MALTKQQIAALNMAKFIKFQSLLLLEKLSELNLDAQAADCASRLSSPKRCTTVCLRRWRQRRERNLSGSPHQTCPQIPHLTEPRTGCVTQNRKGRQRSPARGGDFRSGNHALGGAEAE